MIVLDPHVRVWWVHGDPRLSEGQAAALEENERDAIGVSTIFCWEVAKLVERGRLEFPHSLSDWLAEALALPGVVLLPLTPEVVVESVPLPDSFHRDPADQLIVAPARVNDCPLLTSDGKLQAYPHVTTVA